LLPEDVFQWDVALVEATKSESISEQSSSQEVQQQARTQEVVSAPTKRVSKVSRAVTPVEQNVEPVQPMLETAKPVEQSVEVPLVNEKPVEQRFVEVAEPKEPEPVTAVASTELLERSEPKVETVASTSSSEISAAQEVSPPFLHQGDVETAPVQQDTAPVAGSETKVDQRWLAESLWRRVAELKRYPSSARLNGQEGKVIVKATIRSNGQLADVSVQRSSGHSVLDEAAIEVVKLACPLHVKHAISKPLVVVSLPIVYSLAN
jgi:protein TonB